jgi:hypothetical protein
MDTDEFKRVTIRKYGKAHRALVCTVTPKTGKTFETLRAVCMCPGSASGWLAKDAQIVCDGWDQADCGN